MKKERKTNSKQTHFKTIAFSICLGVGLVLAIIYGSSVYNSVRHKPPSSTELMRQGQVTKTFKKAGYPSNVIFYDDKTTPDIAKADFDTSEYHRIDLLMYSDGCPTCNNERNQLQKKVGLLANKGYLVILINDNQNLKPLRKHFKFPQHYRFPMLFEFTKDDMGKIVLVNQKLLL